jgi:hypothetical protein
MLTKKSLLILVALLFFAVSVQAMTLAWDPYSDPQATDLRVYHSTSSSGPWSLLVDSIPKDKVSSEIPDGADYTRIYYLMRAYDSAGDQESADSNIVSFYWTTGGAGHEGPAGIQEIKLLDCDSILSDPTNPDYELCTNRHVP